MAHTSDVFPLLRQLIEQGREANWHHGMQVYVSQAGQVLADFAIGEHAPGEPLHSDTLMLWLSSGKPLTAVAIMQLQEAGKLSIDAAVAQYIPEFAAAGKAAVTVRQLLTHTAGLKPLITGWPQMDDDEIVARIARAPLQDEWQPGEQGAYDPGRSWFILGEIVNRLTGRTIDRYVREELLEPLGMFDSWMALPAQLHAAYGNRIGITYGQKDGQLVPTNSHSSETCAAPAPGGSLRGPAADLGKFYEMLLRGGTTITGQRLLTRETVQAMTQRQRRGMLDGTFRHVLDFGLGLIINSSQYGPETVPYGFGRYASPESFGHGGAQSSIGFADPERQLVVVMIANGCPGELVHNRRFRALANTLYEELEFA